MQYERDLYNTLAYPDGLVIKFRYRKKWVDEEFWKAAQEDSLKGKDVMVIAALESEWKSDSGEEEVATDGDEPIDESAESEQYFDFYPLRKGEIVVAEIESGYLYIYFRLLNEWADPNHESYENIFDSGYEGKYPVNQTQGPFLNEIESLSIEFIDDQAWEGITKKIGDKERLKGGIFYRVQDIKRVDKKIGNTSVSTSSFRGEDRKRQLMLKSNKSYVMDIVFDYGGEIPTGEKEAEFCITPGNYIEFDISDIPLGISGDVENILLQTPSLQKSRNTQVQLSVKNIEGPRVHLPFEIKAARSRWVYAVLLFAGILFTTIGPVVLAILFPDSFGAENALGKGLGGVSGAGLVTFALWKLNQYQR